jgi:EAL domain-containing protein (putative c-di-GMP-specific phosphodiesterase class I)/GGDEF domain-containing protein
VAEDPGLQRQLLKHLLRNSGGVDADELLFDQVTSLPGLPVLVRQVDEALKSRKSVGILTVNIARFSKLEDVYGWELFDDIVRGVAECLKDIKNESLRKEDALAELTLNGNVFILMLSPARTSRRFKFGDLLLIKSRIAERLDAHVAKTLHPDLVFRFNYFIGSAMMKKDPSVRLERLVYRTIDEALADATTEQEQLVRQRARKLRSIVAGRRIRTLFQPIVDLRANRTIGYEALSRGPSGEFESPDVLFRVAYEADLVLKLDSVCRTNAVRSMGKLRADELLFVNMEPGSIFDPRLMESIPARHVRRVVFEITEHAAISDFQTFRQAAQFVKQSGFKLAMDDVGSAYSGLRIVSMIEPDFIKLDMELTREARRNRVKMELLKAIAGFSNDAGIPMIVEGIETQEELDTVAQLGVHLVQGYLMGRPMAMPAKRQGRSMKQSVRQLSGALKE